MTTPTELDRVEQSIWEELRQETILFENSRRKRVKTPGDIGVYVAVHRDDPAACLKIETPKGTFRDLKFPKSKGISITLERDQGVFATAGGAQVDRIVFKSVDGRDAVFTVFANSIVDVVSALGLASDLQGTLQAHVRDWQEMLSRPAIKAPGQAEAVGMFGELLFLRDFMMRNFDATAAVGSWTGPLADRKDFVHGRVGYELKTTRGTLDDLVVISSVEQLDSSDLDRLYLVHHALVEDMEDGTNLMELAEGIRFALASDKGALEVFNCLLEGKGWSVEAMSAVHARTRYRLETQTFFDVDKFGFPRHTKAMRVPGVYCLVYKIRPSECIASSVDIRDVEREIRS